MVTANGFSMFTALTALSDRSVIVCVLSITRGTAEINLINVWRLYCKFARYVTGCSALCASIQRVHNIFYYNYKYAAARFWILRLQPMNMDVFPNPQTFYGKTIHLCNHAYDALFFSLFFF